MRFRSIIVTTSPRNKGIIERTDKSSPKNIFNVYVRSTLSDLFKGKRICEEERDSDLTRDGAQAAPK